jgi:hypothetical protein
MKGAGGVLEAEPGGEATGGAAPGVAVAGVLAGETGVALGEATPLVEAGVEADAAGGEAVCA